jgi:hypothetical protein
MYSLNMQTFQQKIFYILDFAKKKLLKSDVVNGTSFETYKNYQILSFLCGLKYKVLWVEILHVDRLRYH